MIKAVLFDLDGTLADTEYHAVMKKLKVLENNGVPYSDELFQKICGRKLQITIREALPEYPEEKIQQILDEYYSMKRDDNYPQLKMPQADETLKQLHESGYRMAVVSTNLREVIRKAVDDCGWHDYFDLVMGMQDVAITKPNPDVYLKAMERLNVNADETVIVEDSRVGLDAAIAAGATVICRKENRYNVDQKGADFYVDELGEIPALIKEF